jgi:hypothetical protein
MGASLITVNNDVFSGGILARKPWRQEGLRIFQTLRRRVSGEKEQAKNRKDTMRRKKLQCGKKEWLDEAGNIAIRISRNYASEKGGNERRKRAWESVKTKANHIFIS